MSTENRARGGKWAEVIAVNRLGPLRCAVGTRVSARFPSGVTTNKCFDLLSAAYLAGYPMRLVSLRQFALSLPHTTWVKQWGDCLVFKVAGKMFLILALDAETVDGVIFKCLPEEFDPLTEIEGITQAPYCAKRHWVRVGDLEALPAADLERRIRHSYDLVVAKLPKKVQATLKVTGHFRPKP